jgi:hypothetical protein
MRTGIVAIPAQWNLRRHHGFACCLHGQPIEGKAAFPLFLVYSLHFSQKRDGWMGGWVDRWMGGI